MASVKLDEGTFQFWGHALVDAVRGAAEGGGFCKVELLEDEVAESVEGVVDAQVFVGETRSSGVGEGAEGFD